MNFSNLLWIRWIIDLVASQMLPLSWTWFGIYLFRSQTERICLQTLFVDPNENWMMKKKIKTNKEQHWIPFWDSVIACSPISGLWSEQMQICTRNRSHIGIQRVTWFGSDLVLVHMSKKYATDGKKSRIPIENVDRKMRLLLISIDNAGYNGIPKMTRLVDRWYRHRFGALVATRVNS